MADESHSHDAEMADDEVAMLEEGEGEEIVQDDDAAMDSDDDQDDQDDLMEGEIQLQNDSIAHFDSHTDSIFCIAQHPTNPHIIATGAGDDTAYVFSRPTELEVQQKYAPSAQSPRDSIPPLNKLSGHTDSINGMTFTLPKGEFLVTAGLDGQLRAWKDSSSAKDGSSYAALAHVREVEEINFITACPHPEHPNTIAIGASDGSIWVYTVDASDSQAPLQIVQAFYLHTASATAGAWSADGTLLGTVSEDGSFYVWDVFGDAAAAGISSSSGSHAVVGLTADDERFRVDGGLYSVAIAPTGAFAAVGGAEGMIRIIGLPRFGGGITSATAGVKGGAGAKAKAGGGKQSGGPKDAEASAGQAGQILAALQIHGDGVETLAFSPSPLVPLLASGSVDGSIAFYDTSKNFAVRKHLKGTHEGHAVIKVEFMGSEGTQAFTLTSCGNDGVVRRWDARGEHKMLGEYKGHRGGGEGGGVFGFVQGGEGGRYISTAGDEYVLASISNALKIANQIRLAT